MHEWYRRRVRAPRFLFGLSVPLVLVALTGCKPKERSFESVCQVIRKEPVEVDSEGKLLQFDVELEWDPCPGDQYQVVRGGGDFGRCMEKYKIGDLVPVRVVQLWDTRGYFFWDVYEVGDCARPVERAVEGSYEKSQECSDTTAYGRVNGFSCSRKPFKQLVSICPWMSRN
jgi:hypothetical protein